MPKIYTRTGDEGETGLFARGRIRKDDPRLDAIGTIDELNAAIGLVRIELGRMSPPPADLNQFAERTQHQLFNLGAELAMPQPAPPSVILIEDADVARLEDAIDHWDGSLEPLREFILPGGCPAAAHLHFARCICRRAERLLVGLAASKTAVRSEALRYVNRLSDALFVAARFANHSAGVPDVKWKPAQ